MGDHLLKNWIVYVMLCGFIWFVVYMIIYSRKEGKKEQEKNKQGKARDFYDLYSANI